MERPEKLPAVEQAKTLMTEAITWSVMKWLREKKTVRKAADQANAALDRLNQAVKDRWPDALRVASETLTGAAAGKKPKHLATVTPEIAALLKTVKEADEQAYRARMDAEETFDQAEKQMSTTMAREGCRKAIHSWELHEKAIRKAEAAISSR